MEKNEREAKLGLPRPKKKKRKHPTAAKNTPVAAVTSDSSLPDAAGSNNDRIAGTLERDEGSTGKKRRRGGGAVGAAPSSAAKTRQREHVASGVSNHHPFPTEYGDHFETPLQAYRDIEGALGLLSKLLGKKRKHLRIWDPYVSALACETKLHVDIIQGINTWLSTLPRRLQESQLLLCTLLEGGAACSIITSYSSTSRRSFEALKCWPPPHLYALHSTEIGHANTRPRALDGMLYSAPEPESSILYLNAAGRSVS